MMRGNVPFFRSFSNLAPDDNTNSKDWAIKVDKRDYFDLIIPPTCTVYVFRCTLVKSKNKCPVDKKITTFEKTNTKKIIG